MSKHGSISDFLVASGWVISSDAKGSYFYKDGKEINAAELAGHSVETFAAKARQRGWIPVKGDRGGNVP